MRPPWAPTPGSRKTVLRHQLAQALEVVGGRGADDRADVGETRAADAVGAERARSCGRPRR